MGVVKAHSKKRSTGILTSTEWSAIYFFVVLQVVVFAYFHLSLNSQGDSRRTKSIASKGVFRIQTPPIRVISENERAAEYVSSFKSLDRKLSFIHIPKTAGTAIEQIAAESGIAWGSCLFKHVPRRKVCPHLDGEEWPKNVGWWHVPAQFFPLGGSDPYLGQELFGVIRNPFDRMVSEFFYLCTLKVKEWRPSQCDRQRLKDADYMNEWLAYKLQNNQGSLALEYLVDNSHFTPHYDFIVGPHEIRMIDFILRLDNRSTFQHDFQNLMKTFDLHLVLRTIQSISSHEQYVKNGTSSNISFTNLLTSQHLNSTTKRLINKKFERDISLMFQHVSTEHLQYETPL